jgi:FkbM family methyltransferase
MSLSSTVKEAFRRSPRPIREVIRGFVIPPMRAYFRYSRGPGRHALWRIASHLWWLERPVTARTLFGARMRVNAQEIGGRYIYWFGHWEPNLSSWLRHTLKPGDGFVDVGANIGYFSILASQLVDDGPVVAIEALPDAHQFLVDNLKRNKAGNVRAVNAAAWDSRRELDFFASAGDPTEKATVYESLARNWGLSRRFMVRAFPLSELLTEDELSRTRVIKIDVEGAELHVLRGLMGLLPRCRQDLELVVEVTPEALAEDGDGWQTMIDLLAAHGYKPRIMPNDYSVDAYFQPRFQYFLPITEIPQAASAFDVVFSPA